MKRCLACNVIYPTNRVSCPDCAYAPGLTNGFPSFAPEFGPQGEGFEPAYFAQLARAEDKHFWFRARNQLILWMLSQHKPAFESLLEIGCGTGYVLSGIAQRFPDRRFVGSELFSQGLKFAADRLPTADFMQMDARCIPYDEEFDVIGAFDVLEHIREDEAVIHQAHAALKPGGLFLMTVPQHQWLWSPVDEQACHVRRYSKRELHTKVIDAGFEILRSTSFVTSLLPLMWASRRRQSVRSNKDGPAHAELSIPLGLSALFYHVLRCEVAFIKAGCNFPAGGSLLVAARKRHEPADPTKS